MTELDALPLAAMQAQLAANRFLPAPPAALMSCGDGDFRAIGAEFLGHFVRYAGLQPNERVLDLGCGVGRIAVPLTQYIGDAGTYVGVDVWLQAPRVRLVRQTAAVAGG